jgi:predicted Zn-dependent protease
MRLNLLEARMKHALAKIFVLAAPLALLAGCAEVLQVRDGGFNIISIDEEWRMGKDLHRQVAREHKLVRDRQALAYLNRVGQDLASRTPLAGRQWQFHLIESDDVNAFNIPGGHVYVHTALVREAETLDELTGVLAHEVGHGAARHGTQILTRSYGFQVLARFLLGSDPKGYETLLANVAGTGVLMDYSREAEREADRLGLRYMTEAGYRPEGFLSFLERILDARKGSKPSHLERFFSSHPITEERIRSVDGLIRSIPHDDNLLHDTMEYQAFRSRIAR